MKTFRGKLPRVAGALALVGSLAFGAPAAAQEDPASESRVSELGEEIQILSSSLDGDGVAELVIAIPPEMGDVDPEDSNFALVQGGRRRALRVSEVQDEVDVVLVVDTSGSMRGAPLAAAKDAAISFVDEMPEQARIAVIGFGADPSVASELTTDRGASTAAIRALNARGETALWDAMVEAGQLVERQGRSAPYVVLLSDGGDTASKAGIDEAVAALSSGDRNPGLYVVTLETAESDHSALNDAADRLGGQLLTTQSTETIQEFYVDIAGRLRSRYSIRFLPGQGEVAVLSVAVDDSIATARTSLAGLGITDAPVVIDESEPVASSLNDFVEPQLGTVLIDAPGLLGRSGGIWLGAASMFGALLVVFGFLTVPAMQVQSLGSVRNIDARGQANDINQRLSGAADRFIRRRDDSGALDLSLDAANLELRAGEFTVLLLVGMLAAGAVGSILFGWVGSIAAIVATALAAVAYVSIRIRRRRRAFADQLQNTINIIVGSLRAGRGLPQALEMVAQEASAPTSEEFRRVIVESRVGRDPIVSIEAVALRMDNPDLEWIAQAMAINRELGGDLIELLQNVAKMVRERSRIAMRVRALSAEGRLSGWVMLALPILMYMYMRVVNPAYVSLLHTTSAGLIVSVGAAVAMVLGGIWIRNLVNIKF